MRAAAAGLLLLLLVGCSDDGKGDTVRPGTYAGSTKADQPFTLEVGEEVRVNKAEGRFVDNGVIEVGDADEDPVHGTVTCTYLDDDFEELRCDVELTAREGATYREVVDLMLL